VNQNAEKIVILHNGVFVGKSYHSGGPFVLNVTSDAANGNASTSFILLSLWICVMVDLVMLIMLQ